MTIISVLLLYFSHYPCAVTSLYLLSLWINITLLYLYGDTAGILLCALSKFYDNYNNYTSAVTTLRGEFIKTSVSYTMPPPAKPCLHLRKLPKGHKCFVCHKTGVHHLMNPCVYCQAKIYEVAVALGKVAQQFICPIL